VSGIVPVCVVMKAACVQMCTGGEGLTITRATE